MHEEVAQQHLDELSDVDVVNRFVFSLTPKQETTCDALSDVFSSLKFESKSCAGTTSECIEEFSQQYIDDFKMYKHRSNRYGRYCVVFSIKTIL